ncbi:hypothetical protein B0T16DRAFT_490474 [Cercophora newfieldiana]|uniref:Azaphilone pigments biosynthesis cluster protein L N-terminal domain-containing protein n=1 Tax=Cercophora newfieldiana TaxID=92897 RepID=A0AA39YKH2_9PEZI|nr:hypothetical protein B0T16DRAFT_490474 [Cercophora newfieldiana]
MDPLSVGAGAVAFITIAIQSSKVIYEILAHVKDSPRLVRDVSRDVEQLRHILDRLSNFFSTKPCDRVIALLLQRCSEDISIYAHRLRKLNPSPTERQTGKLWKKLTAVMSEKELQAMKHSINHHVSSLVLQTSLTQIDLIWESKHHLQNLVSEIRSAPAPSASSASGLVSCCQHGRSLPAPEGHQAADSKALTRERQSDILQDLVLLQVPHLIYREEYLLQSMEARAVATLLEQMISAAMDRLSTKRAVGIQHHSTDSAPRDTTKASKRQISVCTDVELELRLMSRLITSSRQISVNHCGRRRPCRERGTIVSQQRKRKKITIDEGLLMLTSLKRSRLPMTTNSGTSSFTHFEAAGREFRGTVSFFPTNPLSSLMIIASVHQEEVRGGTYCETPRLCVNRLLPSDSRVFNLVREGRLEELQAMVSRGEASLRDRDVQGMSLLHYATSHPATCRFLIDSGADVNEIAGKSDQAESLPILSATTRATTSVRGSAEFEAAKECIQILLRSGADPTISLKSRESPFHLACTPKDIDILDVFLDLGREFAHIELADSHGRTPLLRICSWYSTYSVEAFSYLIDAGADINARDSTNATCLHLAIENAKRPHSDELDVLCYLVHRGADVNAVTAEGMSVSDVAYNPSSTDIVYKLGSYRGDLWDAVLARTGHNPAAAPNDRQPKQFTASYIRADFEALWNGQEHLCPYFHDQASTPAHDIPSHTSEDALATKPRRRSFEASIRQRTDISITVETLSNVTGASDGVAVAGGPEPRYDQYEGSCVSSHAAFVGNASVVVPSATVPLLWDPSLVHHLMPNPWHDIVEASGDGCAAIGDELPTAWIDEQGKPHTSDRNDDVETAGKTLGRDGLAANGPVWYCLEGMETENVWDD